MKDLTNNHGIGLAMAVWLAHDDYTNGAEEFPGKNVISATALLKSTRKIVLESRVPPGEGLPDVADLIPSRRGHAFHDSIEHAWKEGHVRAMQRLGYPQKVIDRVLINPDPDAVVDGDLPVYLEQRAYRMVKVDGHEIIVSGKFDQVIDGEINDTKSTSTFAWTKGSKDEDYVEQMSLYRWLNPKIVTSDMARINFIFTDWLRFKSKTDPNYPALPAMERVLELKSIQETENWVVARLRDIIRSQHLPEEQLPRCTDRDLWKSDPEFKYYTDPKKAAEGGRATKNFPNFPAAEAYRNQKGKGVVVTIPGKVKACSYCAGFDLCSQKDEYDHD